VICAPLGAGASDFTPKVQRILEADPVVRPAEVIEVTEVTGGDGGRGAQERGYTVRHRLRFDSGTRTVESTVGSFSEIEPGRTVWVLYDPARPGLGRQAELGRDQLEALQGGPAEPFWTVLTACHLGIAGMFAASA